MFIDWIFNSKHLRNAKEIGTEISYVIFKYNLIYQKECYTKYHVICIVVQNDRLKTFRKKFC